MSTRGHILHLDKSCSITLVDGVEEDVVDKPFSGKTESRFPNKAGKIFLAFRNERSKRRNLNLRLVNERSRCFLSSACLTKPS